MDHLTDLDLADLLDGVLSESDRSRIEKHLLECARCGSIFVQTNQHREVQRQIPLHRDPDDTDSLSADAGSTPTLASRDRSIIVGIRRPRPDGPLRAYLIADRETLSRGPKLVLPNQPTPFPFHSDGTVDLVGIREEDIGGATLEFPLELIPMDKIEDLGGE